jgi:DNA primase large subunit
MQRQFSRFAKNDYAKYPFLKEATKYVQLADLRIEDLTNPDFPDILKRAEERLKEAIETTKVTRKLEKPEIEISSYALTMMIAAATQNSFIQERYALAEAKQTEKDLNNERNEPSQKLLVFARNFGWSIEQNHDNTIPYEFAASFTDYLRNTAHLRDGKWKLINRIVSNGKVFLRRDELARLLSEEVRRHIRKRLERKDLPEFPTEIIKAAERIKVFTNERIGETEMQGFPQIVVQTAFPPCIQTLYAAFSSGHHLSHVGRFTLTSFLISVGMPTEKVVELFKGFSDFNERLTRYQVEHIAGDKGSRTRYIPPRCDTLRTHGVCINPDDLCRKVRHPLGYYRRKTRPLSIRGKRPS